MSSSEPVRGVWPPPSPPRTRDSRWSSSNGPRSAAAPRRGRAAGCGRRATPSPTPTASIEDVEQFRTYLRAVLGEHYDAARVDAFLAAAPDMVGFFHERTALQFVPGATICDVYGDLPGAGTGHRSVAPAPVDGRGLGPDVLQPAAPPALRDLVPRHGHHGRAGPDGVPLGVPRQPARPAARHPAGHPPPVRPRHPPSRRCSWSTAPRWSGGCCGRRWTPGSRCGCARPSPSCCATRTGVSPASSRAGSRSPPRRGVVLAAGGFPQDAARRKELFPRTPDRRRALVARPRRPPTARARRWASRRAGGSTPAAPRPRRGARCRSCPTAPGRTGVFPHIMDRAKPGSIGVLSTGRRFVNEANGYYDYVAAMIAAAPEGEPVQAWQIADARFVRRFPLGMAKPRPVPLWPYLRQRLPEARAHARGAGPRVRDRPGRAGGDGRAVQRGRPARRGPGLRPRLDPVQPLRRRPVGGPQPVAGAAGEGPVLRGAGRARQLRHVRGPGHRRPRPGAGRRRHPDRPASTPSATTRRA